MTTFAPWTAAIADALGRAGGDWLDVEEVLAVGMAAVSPGRAIQQREAERRRNNARHTPTSNRVAGPKPITDDERIRAGARDLARRGLHSLVRRGRAERDGDRVRSTR